MAQSLKQKRGFTLIELLVVISIIGILSSLSMVSVNVARKKARDVKRIADMSQVQLALYLYYDDHQQQFPPATDADPATNWDTLTTALNGGSTGGQVYIARMPVDPQPSRPEDEQYNYVTDAYGLNYTLTYTLEEGGERLLIGQ